MRAAYFELCGDQAVEHQQPKAMVGYGQRVDIEAAGLYEQRIGLQVSPGAKPSFGRAHAD